MSQLKNERAKLRKTKSHESDYKVASLLKETKKEQVMASQGNFAIDFS